MAAKLSIHTEKFLAGLNDKFHTQHIANKVPGKFYAKGGRKYDHVFHETEWNSKFSFLFIDRVTGDIIKSAGQAPQRNPDSGALAIRYNVATEEGYEQAVKAADQFSHFTYAR